MSGFFCRWCALAKAQCLLGLERGPGRCGSWHDTVVHENGRAAGLTDVASRGLAAGGEELFDNFKAMCISECTAYTSARSREWNSGLLNQTVIEIAFSVAHFGRNQSAEQFTVPDDGPHGLGWKLGRTLDENGRATTTEAVTLAARGCARRRRR